MWASAVLEGERLATDATITLNADGSYADATPAALALLRVTLDDFLTSQPGRFAAEPADPDVEAAFREQWEGSGSPDLGGIGTIRRADGSKIRVRFVMTQLDDGRYLAALDEVAGGVEDAPRVFTLGEVLSEWRTAERRLETVPSDTAEWSTIQEEIASLRDRYQRLFEIRRQAR